MQKLIDKLCLFGLCLLALSLTEILWSSVVIMLAAVAASSLCGYLEERQYLLCAAYTALCLYNPAFAVFLPLIVYDCAGLGRRMFRFCWCAALPAGFFIGDPRIPAVIILSCGAAFLLQHRTSAQLETRHDFFALTDETKERSAQLERKNRELMEKQDVEVRLATLAERNRIAREIHDNVGHLLTRSILQIGALRVTHSGSAGLDRELQSVNDTLSGAMDSIRNSVHDLHDESVDLRLQLETMTAQFSFCPVKLRYDAGELPVELRICFAAVVREGLSNIARHSNAAEASVTVTEHPAFCQLIIWDNGTAQAGRDARGMGLQNMADRVGALGGIFRAKADKGFKVFISVPKGGGR